MKQTVSLSRMMTVGKQVRLRPSTQVPWYIDAKSQNSFSLLPPLCGRIKQKVIISVGTPVKDNGLPPQQVKACSSFWELTNLATFWLTK
ncbi:hypothetical protein OH492_10710 [Vibrio chagasii]|nr:hypothetical protein [Vibrio chagasii]